MSSHLSCECQDVKMAADKTFVIYLFIGGTTSTAQRKALLNTITKEQFKVLTLVLYNIVHIKITTESIDQKRLKRYRRSLSVITDKKVRTSKRLSTLKKNPAKVVVLLRAALPGLRTSLSS